MTTTVFVHTRNTQGPGKWSRYVFPFAVDAFAQLGNVLYVRHGDYVSRVDEDAVTDDVAGSPVAFDGVVQWPWLDFGQAGVTKMLRGVDIVAEGSPTLQVGYNQRSTAAYTTAHTIDPDTLNGGMVPIRCRAPTFSLKLTFAGGEAWRLMSAALDVQPLAGQP
jgi:hypothetical protein